MQQTPRYQAKSRSDNMSSWWHFLLCCITLRLVRASLGFGLFQCRSAPGISIELGLWQPHHISKSGIKVSCPARFGARLHRSVTPVLGSTCWDSLCRSGRHSTSVYRTTEGIRQCYVALSEELTPSLIERDQVTPRSLLCQALKSCSTATHF